jgi:hypothetical protein
VAEMKVAIMGGSEGGEVEEEEEDGLLVVGA